MEQPFIKGMELSDMFFEQVVKSLLAEHFPGLVYSAARLDTGSDVLGFDTPMSRDHDWGPRLTLYLQEKDFASIGVEINRTLAEKLPYSFMGYSTNFTHRPAADGVLTPIDEGPVAHYITITTVKKFFEEYIGLVPSREMEVTDWLVIPQQKLRTLTSGRVFHDGLDRLFSIQKDLEWYPQDVWLYLLVNQWQQINQEEPFMGRTGDVDDEIGSRLISARLVQNIKRLCFLMEKTYAPYSKWFGTAFKLLDCADDLMPLFDRITKLDTWNEREAVFSEVYRYLGNKHNQLGIAPPVEVVIQQFHNRPYLVPDSERYVEALYGQIRDEAVLSLPRFAGSVDQMVQSIDVLESVELCLKVKAVYGIE